MPVNLYQGDNLKALPLIADNSIDSIVTDPPYGISFCNHKWDYDVPSVELWKEAFRVLKPGAHLLSFSGTRTYHRMVVNIEDAGFEIRDQIGWLYGNGRPPSHDISKDLDRRAGAVREVVGRYQPPGMDKPWNLQWAKDERSVDIFSSTRNNLDITAPETAAAKKWAGWGTALRPSWEPIVLARKPVEGSIADNVLTYGTGGINIDASRIPTGDAKTVPAQDYVPNYGNAVYGNGMGGGVWNQSDLGRWPANVIHDASEEVLDAFASYGLSKSTDSHHLVRRRDENRWQERGGYFNADRAVEYHGYNDRGSAARFFYSAKAGKEVRCGSSHPTIKPLVLLEYLIKMVTPPGGVVLDPFAGSGTTGQGAAHTGFNAVLIEREAEYCDDIRRRLTIWLDKDVSV